MCIGWRPVPLMGIRTWCLWNSTVWWITSWTSTPTTISYVHMARKNHVSGWKQVRLTHCWDLPHCWECKVIVWRQVMPKINWFQCYDEKDIPTVWWLKCIYTLSWWHTIFKDDHNKLSAAVKIMFHFLHLKQNHLCTHAKVAWILWIREGCKHQVFIRGSIIANMPQINASINI